MRRLARLAERFPVVLGRDSAQAMSRLLSRFHLGMAMIAFIRPNLAEEIMPSYRPMADIMPTVAWGCWALVAGLGLAVMRPGSLGRITAQIISAFLLTALSVLIAAGRGLNWGVWVYGLLALVSIELIHYTAEEWFESRPWYRRLCAKVGR